MNALVCTSPDGLLNRVRNSYWVMYVCMSVCMHVLKLYGGTYVSVCNSGSLKSLHACNSMLAHPEVILFVLARSG